MQPYRPFAKAADIFIVEKVRIYLCFSLRVLESRSESHRSLKTLVSELSEQQINSPFDTYMGDPTQLMSGCVFYSFG